MTTYTFANQKGGPGKSTTSINFAAALHLLTGARVLFIDTDPQGTALDWAAARTAADLPGMFTVVGYPRVGLHKELSKIAEGYDHVVIDSPARATDIPRSNILAADVVVVPIQPSPLDMWASDKVLELLEEASVFKDNLKAVFLVSRRIVGTSIGKSMRQALADQPYPVLEATIGQRVVYIESFIEGQTVLETEPDSSAADEIRELTRELVNL